jgi:hypothetical protein
VASLSDEHSYLKKFLEFSKGVKRGNNDYWINLCYLGKHTLSKHPQILFVPSGPFIGRTFAFKKVFGVFKRGVKRGIHDSWINLSYLGKHNPFKTSSNIFVLSGKFIGRTFAFKKVFGVFKRGVKRGIHDSWINLSYLGKHTLLNPLRSKWQVYRTNIRF